MTEFVCANCFEDEGVRNFIRDFGDQNPDEQGQCSYCDNEDGVDVDRVAKYILNERLLPEWEDAANCSPYDGKNGGFLYPTSDTYDIITDGELGIGIDNDDLRNDIINALPDNLWVSKGFLADWGSDDDGDGKDEPFFDDWDSFCDFVKYNRRYFFPHEDVSRVLDGIIEQVKEYVIALCQSPIYRARIGCFREHADIKEPPREIATSNRMSPAGIRMFYGCYEPEASLREICNKDNAEDGAIITVGEFAITKPFSVFDISDPRTLSNADDEKKRKALQILVWLAEKITMSVPDDGKPDIDYVPTQIFAEYLRTNPSSLGAKIGGIAYSSAKQNESVCVALFGSDSLKLTKLRYYRISLRDGHSKIIFEPVPLDLVQAIWYNVIR